MLIEFNGYLFESGDIYYVGEIHADTNLKSFEVLVRNIPIRIRLAWVDQDFGSEEELFQRMEEIRSELIKYWKGDREIHKIY